MIREHAALSEWISLSIRRRGRFHSLLAAVLLPRRDDPERLLEANIQVVDCLRYGATVGIGHHVPGIIHEVEVGAADHIV